MRKIFCDHCGKDITREPVSELSIDDCFLLGEKWIGHGCELCTNCWKKRERLHAQLDADFLHVNVQNGDRQNGATEERIEHPNHSYDVIYT